MASPSREQPFVLGGLRVDPARGVIARADGREIHLEPRAMDLLMLFAAEPNTVLSKERIIASVWGGRAIGDDTLAGAVSKLRSALGDCSRIETIPKRGYRLLQAEGERAPSPPRRASSECEALIAKGIAALATPLPQGAAQARLYFEGAIKSDPSSSDAHAGLAETMLAQHRMGLGRDLAVTAKAVALAATSLDALSARAWSTLGYATLIADRDFATADLALTKAISFAPASSAPRRIRAFALSTVGRFAEAEREARRVLELEPLSLRSRTELAQLLLLARRYAHALAEAKRAIAASAQSAEAWFGKGWAHYFLGDEKEAVPALLEGLKLFGTDAAGCAELARTYAHEGFATFCARGADLFDKQKIVFTPRPTDIAMLRTAAGEADAAFAALDVAAERDDPFLLLLPYLPHLDRLRNDARFAALLERVRPVRA
jgi:DNA-binding winged helix-turn-helix (wHTH) protein/Flp pilus assembly protein TadD